MSNPKNNPAKAGKLAAFKQFFGHFARFAVAPIHTRFDAVEWFVWDADRTDEFGCPAVVGQLPTREAAIARAESLAAADAAEFGGFFDGR